MKLETLRAEIQKGADSGASVSSKAAFAEVRTRIAKVAAGQSGKS